MRLVTHIELEDFELETIRELATAAGKTAEAFIHEALGLEGDENTINSMVFATHIDKLSIEELDTFIEGMEKRRDAAKKDNQAEPTTTPDDIALDVYARSLTDEELQAEIDGFAERITELEEELQAAKERRAHPPDSDQADDE